MLPVILTMLCEAAPGRSGGKAGTLGALLREGLPVPDGFVVPHRGQPDGVGFERSLRDGVAHELERLGDPVVAVRSSARSEDTAEASAAGQYQSVIGVRGAEDVCQAIVACWESAHAARVGDYWSRTTSAPPLASGMAVLVQPVVQADVSGVIFTAQQPGEPTRIEASWGLGLAVVGGTVTPDTYEVTPDGSIGHSVGNKQTRIDLDHEHGGVITGFVAPDRQYARALDDATIMVLANLGDRIAETLERPQDIEWAVADGTVWVLQSRPITAALPATTAAPGLPAPDPAAALTGTPGSHGTATAAARIVRGPSDFGTVQPGDILVCPYTDPAWTPLFTLAAGIVTETGGALSHAAIVAREYGIPAVLGVAGVISHIEDGDRITLNGTAGIVTIL